MQVALYAGETLGVTFYCGFFHNVSNEETEVSIVLGGFFVCVVCIDPR